MEDAPVEPEVGGRGKKQCKQCQKFCGVRTRVCECGYDFSIVAAATDKMSVDTESTVKGTVSSVRGILSRVEEKNPRQYGGYGGNYGGNYGGHYDYDDGDYYPVTKPTEPSQNQPAPYVPPPQPSWYSKPQGSSEVIDYGQPNDARFFPKVAGRNIVVPSGECPVKPKGYKIGWPDGKASPEVVKEWALAVYHSGDGYAPDAVLYWARYYWDINDRAEFGRIRNLIIEAISPQAN